MRNSGFQLVGPDSLIYPWGGGEWWRATMQCKKTYIRNKNPNAPSQLASEVTDETSNLFRAVCTILRGRWEFHGNRISPSPQLQKIKIRNALQGLLAQSLETLQQKTTPEDSCCCRKLLSCDILVEFLSSAHYRYTLVYYNQNSWLSLWYSIEPVLPPFQISTTISSPVVNDKSSFQELLIVKAEVDLVNLSSPRCWMKKAAKQPVKRITEDVGQPFV